MKVQTNRGKVDLTAEMVRSGMVFQGPIGAPYTLKQFDPYAAAWSDSDGALTEAEVAVEHAFLGCDPAIASSEDCEAYGVAQMHSFAP